MNKNHFLQFELWKDCHIGCSFCFNKHQNDINKEESLNFVLNVLNNTDVSQYNEIGFIGGEFFNGEIKEKNVKHLFYEVFKTISIMNFDKIYITTSLIYDINNDLIPFLNYLRDLNILDKVLLCTSYDIKYRFNTDAREELWKTNMKFLHKMYPNLRLHIETILSQFFIDAVLNGQFNITEFSKTYNARIDYIEPTSGLYYKNKQEFAKVIPDFFPTKSSFIEFLKVEGIEKKEIDLKTFLSMEIRADKLYYIDNGHHHLAPNRRRDGCRINPENKEVLYEFGFIDSDDDMPALAHEFYEIYGDANAELFA